MEQPSSKKRKMVTSKSSEHLPVSVVTYRWADNVFHAINERRCPAEKIFDRPHFYALLDKLPVTRGHCLLITKHPVATLLDSKMPVEAMADAMTDLQVLCKAAQKATGSKGVRVKQNNGPAAGQVVPQLHFHVIPVESPDDEDLQQRSPLQEAAAGALLAAIKNALPATYSGAGVHAWIPTATAMEALGYLLHTLCVPGAVILLSGHLGSGKTAIARGIIRAFCGDPNMFVPSPTFLLNLTYQEDTSHEPSRQQQQGQQQQQLHSQQNGVAQEQQQPLQQQDGWQQGINPQHLVQQQDPKQQQQDTQNRPNKPLQQQQQRQQQQQLLKQDRCIHHMDPYRLGTTDKMAGLIDFEAAFQQDICVIEWPSKMPASVMDLPRKRTIEVTIGGSGAQAAGRLVHIVCAQEAKGQQQHATEQQTAAATVSAVAASSQQQDGEAAGAVVQQQQQQADSVSGAPAGAQNSNPASGADRLQPDSSAAANRHQSQSGTDECKKHNRAAIGPSSSLSSSSLSSSSTGPCATLLEQWREQGLPEPQVACKSSSSHTANGSMTLTAASGQQGGQPPPGPAESWLVLGIESSCDDTAAAVVQGDGTVLAHKIASQVGLHEQYGGVKPDVARDAHAAAIQSTVADAIQAAGIQPQQLSAISVTVGPGLSLCLQVGVRHALSLAAQHQLPWVPVHHMEAHALMAAMPGVMTGQPSMTYPALLLLVSGGHNMLVRCEGVGRHTVLGTTIDDSMGEAFDKVARLLGITAIPGGPHLEQLANSAAAQDKARYKGKLQLPLRHDKTSCNFSFSGLKTSVAKLVESERARLQEEGAEENQVSRVNAAIASVFQEVSVRFLEERTERALLRCQQDAVEAGQPMPTCLVIAGGVAANAKVRSALQAIAARFNLPCLVPPPKFCSDNGLMVAWTGIERLKLGLCRAPPPTVEAVESAIEVLPRWPLGPVDVRGMTKQNAKHCKLLH